MNYDNSIILVTEGGNILIYDVIWGPTTATLVNPRSPYDDANNPGQWEGTTWSRTDRNSMIFIRNSTGTAKIIQRNILTKTDVLLKDFLLDATFTAQYGAV